MVLAMYHSGDGTAGYQASLTVQTTDKSVFVAERPLYWATWAAPLSPTAGCPVKRKNQTCRTNTQR